MNNDETQSALFEALFDGLLQLQAMLTGTLAPDGRPLSEQTTVVVLSEMGRTAQLNGTNGKDHWPFTSAMIVGPATQGGRVFGGFDAGYQGLSLDLSTAEPDDRAPVCSVESVGAALLELGVLMPPSMFPMQTHFEDPAVRVLCWGMLWSAVVGCETTDKSEDSALCTVLSYANFGEEPSMLEHCQGCHSSLLPIPHRAGAPQSIFFF